MNSAPKAHDGIFEADRTRVLEIRQTHDVSAPLSTRLGIVDPAWHYNKVREHRGFLLGFIDRLWKEYSRTLRQLDDCTGLALPTVPSDLSSDELTRKLAAAGVFKGFEGLEGLLNAREFWEQQSYGTRLYYGPGIADYLHRGVLEAAVKILKTPLASQPESIIAGLKRLAALARDEMGWADDADHPFWVEVTPATDWIESLNGDSNATADADRQVGARTAGEAPASDGDFVCPAVPASISDQKSGDGWQENAIYLLDRCPYTIRVHDSEHPDTLLTSLVVTFQKMQTLLERAGRAPSSDDPRDADRYRWIREREHADIASCWLLPAGVDCGEGPEAFDAAVDQAMQLGEQQPAPSADGLSHG